MTPRYGRCEKGKRLIAHAPFGHWKTTTFLAGLRCDGLTAPCVFDGPINGEKFLAYLSPGDIVIMDNLSSHKIAGVRQAIDDGAQKTQEFLMAMARHALADDPAGDDVECREQGRRPVPLAVVGHCAGASFLQRQSRLGAIERLDLALFVDREHQRLVRRIEVKADNVLNFFTEFWVIGELEAARQMRLEPMRRQMRCTLEWLRRTALASLRADQCVARGGFWLSVMATTRSIAPASKGGLRPGRVASRSSPATPHAR